MLKYFTLTVLLMLPILVKAEPIENYFKSDEYLCLKVQHVMELTVIGNTDKSISIERTHKRLDRGNFVKSDKWELNGDEIKNNVTVNNSRGKLPIALKAC